MESQCPNCKAERKPTETVCQSCGYNGPMSYTGEMTNFAPDQRKQRSYTPETGFNIQLASKEIYNSRTGRFVLSNDIERDFSDVDEHLGRIKANPELKDKTKKQRKWRSREFKPVINPELKTNEDIINEKDIEETMNNLAIDG